MKWRVILEQDPKTLDWAAWCPELPGCASAGETESEAKENIREAIELYLSGLRPETGGAAGDPKPFTTTHPCS